MDRMFCIKYGRGSMLINVDTFFPASRARIRKLGKIIRMDDTTDRKYELLEILDGRIRSIRDEWFDLDAGLESLHDQWMESAHQLNEQREVVRMTEGRAAKDAAREKRKRDEDEERKRRKIYHDAVKRKKELERLYAALRENVGVIENEI